MASSSYTYPFPSDSTTTGRIDQGQDFGGTGAIVAIGDARILKVGAPGWPGEHGVLYKLLNGPNAGKNVFVYEGINVGVRPGQIVRAGQKIGSLIPGSSTGIEIGWADKNGTPLSHAEYVEGKETRAGKAFSRFLSSLKAGGGNSGSSPLSEAFNAAVSGNPAYQVAGDLVGGVKSLIPNFPSAAEIVEGLAELLGINASAILLNIGLVGGGAFLVYYGTARAVGVSRPVADAGKLARVGLGPAAVMA